MIQDTAQTGRQKAAENGQKRRYFMKSRKQENLEVVSGLASSSGWEKKKRGLLLPGALSNPARTGLASGTSYFDGGHCLTQRRPPEHSCHWQLLSSDRYGGTTTGRKVCPFPSPSKLFRPHQMRRPYHPHLHHPAHVVEAPGTAPGSGEGIPTAVYRHSLIAQAGLI